MNGYKIETSALHFVTMTVIEWIDVFTRKDYCETIIDSLKYCQVQKGLEIFAYVIMSNHLHLIIACKEGGNLSDILHDFKQFTSRKIVKQIQEIAESRREWMLERMAISASQTKGKAKYYQFWQEGNHAEVLHSNDFILQKLTYLHQNPVRAGIVMQAEHYVYSSAINYCGKKGGLEVILLDL